MSEESLEDRTVEVSGIPATIEDELLGLYFENKRRSGGGPLTSLNRNGGCAVLVYGEAQVAARVLAKGPHVLQSVTLTVRKPAPKDPGKLLLRGINPQTSLELVELYVESVTGIETGDYTLYRSSGKDLVLIHFHTPISKEDFQSLLSKITAKQLDGTAIHPEQIEQTDSILVENVHPTVTEDVLTLYFENKRGGGGEVKDVCMLADGVARVSFVDFEAVDRILKRTHRLHECDLKVQPYFDFLGTIKNLPSPSSPNGTVELNTQSAEDARTESLGQEQTSPPIAAHTSGLVSPPDSAPGAGAADQSRETLLQSAPSTPSSSKISLPDPLKLGLFKSSQLLQDLRQSHPGFEIKITDNAVEMSGPGQPCVEQLKSQILEFFTEVAQVHLTYDVVKARFLAREEVKGRLQQTLSQQGLLATYTVADCVVTITSLSLHMVNEACKLLKSLICEFSIAVTSEYECMLYSKQWSEFLESLAFCSASMSTREEKIEVVTLTSVKEEMELKIIEFLSTPIQVETVITMEPGMLKYIQVHCHQLLADMDQVSVFPLEGEDVTGFRVHGNANACQAADELLRGVVSSVLTRDISVSQPGVARFLVEEEGTNILEEMKAKFQVYISMDKVHWVPLEDQDVFESAWKLTSQQNFQRNSSDSYHSSAQPLNSPLTGTDVNANDLSEADRGLLEEAKRLVSVFGGTLNSTSGPPSVNTIMDEEDLYTAADPDTLSSADNTGRQSADDSVNSAEDALRPAPEGGDSGELRVEDQEMDYAKQLSLEATSPDLTEDAMLSLAIQYSMESGRSSAADGEDELQKALEISKRTVQQCGAAAADSQLEQAIRVSLQDAIRAANTAEIRVYAGYSCDLIRVDIALGKKVSLRQCQETVQHKCLKNLSEHQKKCVDLIKRKHAVEIQIQGTTATISGFKDYVTEAVPDLKQLLKRISNIIPDSEILRTVQWVWHDSKSVPTPYPPNATAYIENAWKMKQKKIDIVFDGQPYSIDFEKMKEYNISSGKSVQISRKLLSSADLYTDIPDEDVSVLSNLPEASRVDEDSDEFQNVVKEFYDSIQEYHNKIKIIKVEKLMNTLLYNQYKLKKASMLQSASDPEVERTLYHGTSETSVKEICIHGFNRSFCGKNATVYGQGVYFAVNSAISVQDQYSPPNADGHKYVFVTKVLTGDFTKGKHEMKTAPLKEGSDIPLRYHSVVDKMDSPTLFVIFNDTQAYPEYLITCQKIRG
ncbi:protein mono-ADP-ribosyltransferase PARP10 [Megalops cyprinoides]|uniref:protein mono-ADP-ribosyltransferase PARP10 n=1 Tax=Megalops cyprinoides TaxID=118141 RepID=UPI001863B5A5|nr:protein mono-ADP-ribosyltransferase PARP10 [Megalops cyprinoides]XP_036371631.1 protein mono-ADP-ribosyltransferase PARP10 [Megalops cyprinoides]